MARYEIYVDQAWTHGATPPNRYFCFFGGIFGETAALDRLDTELRAILAAHGAKGEVKWGHLSTKSDALYGEFVECVCKHIDAGLVRYRQMFCDRAFVREAPPGEGPMSDLDVQFKLCYQFVKHAFGVMHLPAAPAGERHEVLVRLDTHSSQRHKDDLIAYAEKLPAVLGRGDLTVRVTFVNSAKMPRIQVCDLLMGAAGSHGNKMHQRRAPGVRGMSGKQKLRHELAQFVYGKLRDISCAERGSKAFNWFESTGKDGDWTNVLHHKIRIWKFLPQRFRVDAGWQNDHLDKQGVFVASALSAAVRAADGDVVY